MEITIKNQHLQVSVDSLGAQLMSIRTEKCEYLWQGDEKYWKDRAPLLFPFIARLYGEKYTVDGKQYSLPIHGFASKMEFTPQVTDNTLTMTLKSSEETLKCYPFPFILTVTYALEGNTLHVRHSVRNTGEKTMYFGLGGHPGFNVPLEPQKVFEDYRLRFGGKCKPVRVGFSSDCFVNGQDEAFVLEDDRILKLRHELFDDDAIVLRDMAREVTLEAEDGARSVTVSFPDMPYLGIWHRPKSDAPYVCIEPWVSLPAKRGETTVFERQEDLVCLRPGKRYANAWSICINHLEM